MFWKDEFTLLLCLNDLPTSSTLEPQNGFHNGYAYTRRITITSSIDKIEIKTLKFAFQLGLHSTSPSRLDFIFATSCRTCFSCSRMRAGFWYCGKERGNTTLEEQILKFHRLRRKDETNKDPLNQSFSQQQGTHFKSKLTLLQDVEQFTKDSFESNILVWPIRTDHENEISQSNKGERNEEKLWAIRTDARNWISQSDNVAQMNEAGDMGGKAYVSKLWYRLWFPSENKGTTS